MSQAKVDRYKEQKKNRKKQAPQRTETLRRLLMVRKRNFV